jgi:hypothetical protein
MGIYRLLRILCVIILVLSSVGCAVARYHYISLERYSEMKVESSDVPTLRNLHCASKMPIEYSLERKQYRLLFRPDLDSYLPEMLIVVQGADSRLLRMRQQPSRRARDDRLVPCGSFGPVEGKANALHFSWVTCKNAGAAERYLSFDVVAESGELVASEDIPFDLKSNGFYVMPDLP